MIKSFLLLQKSAEVNVKNYNVTLHGSVEYADEKARIADIARQTIGVKGISNNLTVIKGR